MQLTSSKALSTKKVSSDQAAKILFHNSIEVDEEELKTILDFLYLVAKNISTPRLKKINILTPEGDIEHNNR